MSHLCLMMVMIMMMMDSTVGQTQYPDCVFCTDSSISLSPLSYNTMRSNVFNGTQPSNEGCTNGISIDGQVTIDCEQATTLIDCERGLSNDNVNYSDLTNTFTWNRTTSVAEQVSIVFRFDQQINISMITMLFWNSPSNSIIIPNVMIFWSNDDSIMPSNEITITTNSPSRTGDARRRLNIDINDNGLQFQYLRIVMSFYDDSEWIFLGEVQFCGNTAPYHITQPSTDNVVQIVSPTATMASVTCSLNITIPSTVIVTWSHNNLIADPNQITRIGNTTTLLIGNPQPSDAGIYQCVFDDTSGSGWILHRNIRLITQVPQIIYPPEDFHPVVFNDVMNPVRLMCSLNVTIPSSMTVIWTHNNGPLLIAPPNEIITAGNTTTLLIVNPRPSDTGGYQCTFVELNLRRIILLEFTNTSTAVTITSINISTATIIASDATTSISTTIAVVAATVISAASPLNSPTPTSLNSPTLSSSQSDNNNSSSVGVIVAIVVLVVVVIIIITVVVIGIIVVWKRKKSERHTKQEGVYYSTIDEATLQRTPANKSEAVYGEINDEQDSKEPEYMDISKTGHSTEQADKIVIQDNPAYSDTQLKMQDNPAYSVTNM